MKGYLNLTEHNLRSFWFPVGYHSALVENVLVKNMVPSDWKKYKLDFFSGLPYNV